MVEGFKALEACLKVRTQLLAAVASAEALANVMGAILRFNRCIDDGREPTAMALFPRHPSKTSQTLVPFVHGRWEKTWRRTHTVPGLASLLVAQPFSERGTGPTALFGRGIKHDEVATCVQKMAKMMAPSAHSTVGLEQAQFKARRCIQPWDGGRLH